MAAVESHVLRLNWALPSLRRAWLVATSDGRARGWLSFVVISGLVRAWSVGDDVARRILSYRVGVQWSLNQRMTC